MRASSDGCVANRSCRSRPGRRSARLSWPSRSIAATKASGAPVTSSATRSASRSRRRDHAAAIGVARKPSAVSDEKQEREAGGVGRAGQAEGRRSGAKRPVGRPERDRRSGRPGRRGPWPRERRRDGRAHARGRPPPPPAGKPSDQRVADQDPAGPAEADDGRVRDAALAREVGDGDLGRAARASARPRRGAGRAAPGRRAASAGRRSAPARSGRRPSAGPRRRPGRRLPRATTRPGSSGGARTPPRSASNPSPPPMASRLRAVGEPGAEPLGGQARSTREDEAGQHVERERQQRLGAADDQRHDRDDRRRPAGRTARPGWRPGAWPRR